MNLNIEAAMDEVNYQEKCGNITREIATCLRLVIYNLTSPVEQEACGTIIRTTADEMSMVCQNPIPCPIHNKAERTYTESEIVSLFDGLKCLSGLTYCPCLACTLIRRWQSLKHSKGGGE